MIDPIRAYRLLLKLYPTRFREEYGSLLEQQFRDDHREAGRGWPRLHLCTRVLWDFLMTAPAETARELSRDVRYSFRLWSLKPLVPALSIGALAIAIGGATGVFSVVNAVLIRSLPFRDPERLVDLRFVPQESDSPAAFHRWRLSSAYLEDTALYASADMSLNTGADSVRVKVAETSSNFFSLLGSQPQTGRGFASGEDTPGKNTIAIVGYGLWQQVFGGDPRAIGSTIRVNGKPLTVVGIARPEFDYPAATSVWTPTFFDFDYLPKTEAALMFQTIGRLKPGLSLAQARQMFEAEVKHQSPAALLRDEANRAKMIPLQEKLAGPVRQASLALLGAVGLVLLIACANVAILLLSRATGQRKELVIRSALGASRARLVQQLMTESVLLSSIAAIAGLAVAHWAARAATLAQPPQLSRQVYAIVDWRVLAFAAALAVLTGLFFGVFPAWLIGRLQPEEELMRSRPGPGGSGPGRFRRAMIAVQVSLTLVLLSGSIVMGRGFLALLGTDLGFRTGNVLTMRVSLAGTGRTTEQERQYYHEALERLRAVPGVEAAGAIDCLPLETTAYSAWPVKPEAGTEVLPIVLVATPDYFRAMRTGLIAGREFTLRDDARSEPVAVVNEQLVKEAGVGLSLIGKMLKWPKGGGRDARIVGIARTVRVSGPVYGGLPQIFLPVDQRSRGFMTFVARVRTTEHSVASLCRDALRSVDRKAAVFSVGTLDGHLRERLSRPRFYTSVMLFFAVFALLLSLLGVYGVAAYSVGQRTQEIGVRLAVGASSESIRARFLGQTLRPVILGLVVGVAGAVASRGLIAHLMTAPLSNDGLVWSGAALLLAAAAAAAVWCATGRVTRMNPIDVLRTE